MLDEKDIEVIKGFTKEQFQAIAECDLKPDCPGCHLDGQDGICNTIGPQAAQVALALMDKYEKEGAGVNVE